MVALMTPDTRRVALQSKVDDDLKEAREKYGPGLSAIERECSALDDVIVDSSGIGFDDYDHGLVMTGLPGVELPKMTRWAMGQAADRFGINSGYAKRLYDDVSPWSLELLAHTFEQFRMNTETRRLLVRSVFGGVRGVLSDRYRRLNTSEILGSLLTAGNEVGLQLAGVKHDDTQVSIDLLLPQVFEVPMRDGLVEYQSFGARLVSSDYGDGAVTLSMTQNRIFCFNLMVFENVLRQIHLGKRLSDDIRWSDRTYKLDTDTVASQVSDIVRELATPKAIEARVTRLRDAANDIVTDPEPVLKRLPKMTEGDRDGVLATLALNDVTQIPEGPLTRYKLSQAIGYVAQGQETDRKRRDLEELAGKLCMGTIR